MKNIVLIAGFLLSMHYAGAQATITGKTVTSDGIQSTFTQNFSLPGDTGQEVTIEVVVRGQNGYALMTDSVYTTNGRTITTAFPAAAQQKVVVIHCIHEPGESSCFETLLYGNNNGKPELFWINSASDYDTTRIYVGWYKGITGNMQVDGFVANAWAVEDSGWAATHQFDVADAPITATDSLLTISLPNSYLERGIGLKIFAWVTNEYGSSDTTSYLFYPEAYVGINEGSKATLSLCYPNPSQGVFYVQGVNEPATIEFYNQHGQQVYTQSGVIGSARIDLSGLPSGIYTCHVGGPSGMSVGRISIRK